MWDHELADLNRRVGASLTSIVAPVFSMPGVVVGRDWVAGTIGTRVKLASNVGGYLAFTGRLGQNNATSYGGQMA